MHAIAHACVGTHATKFIGAIYSTHEIIVFSLFVLLLLYISHKEKFFIEHYTGNKALLIHNMHPLPPFWWGGGGGGEPPITFSKRGAWQDLNFERG